MNFPSSLTFPLRNKSIAAINHDIEDELEFHIQCHKDELIASGISPEQAELQSSAAFGSKDLFRKQCQRINYGGQIWWILFSITGLAVLMVAAFAICWLWFQLMALKDQNANLAKQLMSAAAAPASSELLAVPMEAVQDRHDLFGIAYAAKKPVAGAKVTLIFKSWPGGQYRQKSLATTTDKDGKFRFEKLYSTNMQTAFLVSVIADGYALKSKYWVNDKREEIKSVKLSMRKAIPKTLTLLHVDGTPMANMKVFPQSRNSTTDGSGGDKIYQQSANEVLLVTDEKGKVAMNYFVAGDQAVIGVVNEGGVDDVEIVIDENAEQVVGGNQAAVVVKKGKADITGTVTGEDGNAVADAMVVLVHKSWPNNRYQQDFYKAKTDEDGKFVFPNRYRLGQQYGLLVSVVADGWAMSSEYVLDEEGDELDPFIFELEKATPKTFLFQDANGKALKRLAVFPSQRKTENNEEFMIYGQSGKDVDVKTDGKGKAKLSCFVAGDTATFGFLKGGSVDVEITEEDEQIVVLKKLTEPAATKLKRWTPDPVAVVPRQVEWVKQHAVKFRSIDPDDTNFEDLQPLKKLIGDARIVQLGEQSHGDGTCFETKIRLIKFLHQEMDFDVLAFESGIFDCHRAWQIYQSGHDPYDAARQGVFGIWTGSAQTQPLWKYLGDQMESDSPLELAGFDCQFTASASRAFLVDDLKAFIQKQKLEALAGAELDSFCRQLQGLIVRENEGEKSVFDEALKKLTNEVSHIVSAEDGEPEFWHQNLKSIQAYADYAWTDEQGEPMKTVADRDAQMANNLIWMHEKQFPGRKIIVWAASFHIIRNPSGIEVPDGRIDYSDVVQMGHRVHEALGEKVFNVGFTAYEGSAGAYFRPKFEIGRAPSGTLEHLLASAEIDNGWLSLNSKVAEGKWLNDKMLSRPLGYGWMKANWGDHFDAMVINREMKPSTR